MKIVGEVVPPCFFVKIANWLISLEFRDSYWPTCQVGRDSGIIHCDFWHELWVSIFPVNGELRNYLEVPNHMIVFVFPPKSVFQLCPTKTVLKKSEMVAGNLSIAGHGCHGQHLDFSKNWGSSIHEKTAGIYPLINKQFAIETMAIKMGSIGDLPII